GHLYRGMRIPALRGRYVFGDFCSGRVWALTETTPGAWGLELLLQSGLNISSFGEDAGGELYVVDHNGAIYALDRR
ncbi:MAG: PQQ-dependent sugar dehydrogenase, partial [Acidimicrobiia bacterium]